MGREAIGRAGGWVGRAKLTGGLGRVGAETEGTKRGAEEDTYEEGGAEKDTVVEAAVEETANKEGFEERGRLGVAIGLLAFPTCFTCRCL